MTLVFVTPAEVLERTAEFVRGKLAGDSSGHDWHHVARVERMAAHLARQEGADGYVASLGALLHDVADWKFHGGDDSIGPRIAGEWLSTLGVAQNTIEEVREIIYRLSFKGAGVATPMPSLSGQVVQDADRLDAVGAIGIARAFAYGGHAGRALHDPDEAPERHDSFEAYKKNKGPTINHFYEKLLLLADRMNTESARAIALERQRFMEEFLCRFYEDWHGPQSDYKST